MVHAYIGIGSNVGDSDANVRRAIESLRSAGTVVAASSLYRTKPWGLTDQSDFVNAVAAVQTLLDAHALLALLKQIEKEFGREETVRWGPRIIDLDLLTYGDEQIDTPALQVPHVQLRERAFVLVPLAEIDPSYAAARDALSASERAGVVRLEA